MLTRAVVGLGAVLLLTPLSTLAATITFAGGNGCVNAVCDVPLSGSLTFDATTPVGTPDPNGPYRGADYSYDAIRSWELLTDFGRITGTSGNIIFSKGFVTANGGTTAEPNAYQNAWGAYFVDVATPGAWGIYFVQLLNGSDGWSGAIHLPYNPAVGTVATLPKARTDFIDPVFDDFDVRPRDLNNGGVFRTKPNFVLPSDCDLTDDTVDLEERCNNHQHYSFHVAKAEVPEPSSVLLFGAGIAFVGMLRRKLTS